jgi:hypothetical protein
VPGRAAELAVGGRLQARLFLYPDGPGDLLVLYRPQVRRRDPAGREVLARVEQAPRAQQAADMIGRNGGLVRRDIGVVPYRKRR